MTDSIPVDALSKDTVRRDRYGRYLIVPPGGGAPIGYTRVTTIAASLDHGGGLAPWKATMCATGLIMRSGLRSRWEALLAEHPNPWYASEDSKRQCKDLVEECSAVGGANDRKETGSALHALTAIADRVGDPSPVPHLTAETQAELDTYLTGCALAGIDVDRTAIELTVVLDEWQVAGTFDRLATVPGFDLPLVADIKTGADLSYSWQSIAMQLAGYSRGEAIYVQGRKDDGSEDQRLDMPDVDQQFGLVLHLPVGERALYPYIVDLNAGWAAFEECLWVREWRARKDLVAPLSAFDTGLMTLLEASLDEAQVKATRNWLQDRIDAIGKDENARKALRTQWPPGVPTLRSSDSHTSDQLDTIEQTLDVIERAHSLPFPAPKPVTRATSPLPD